MGKLTSRVLSVLKKTLLISIVGLLVWWIYKFTEKMLSSKKPSEILLDFAESDSIQFLPKAMKEPTELKSDKTLHALLSGKLGPAVVMVYAHWCVHCSHMMPAFVEAAKLSSIPFVIMEGQYAPVTSKKFAVQGYPTVFGVVPGQDVLRFGETRTTSNLLQFARSVQTAAGVVSLPEVKELAEVIEQPTVQVVPVQPEVTEVVEVLDDDMPGLESA